MQAEKRLLVNLLIQEIVLYDDKIEIYFNNPTTKSPDDGQGFLFYSGKSKMVIENKDNDRDVSALKSKTKSLNQTRTFTVQFRLLVVLLTGLEPVRSRPRGILSPLCLPIPPQQHTILKK